MSRYDLQPTGKVKSQISDLLSDRVQFLVYGEAIRCDLLIVRYPPVLRYRQIFIPNIEAGEVRVIVNQPPMSDYGPSGVLRYQIPECVERLKEYFGKSGTWHPIGPAVREALEQHHANDLRLIDLSLDDWVNIIDVAQWRRSLRPVRSERPRIGRHARDHVAKWPEKRETLLKVYPDSEKYEIRILGGATVPEQLLGSLPRNWNVLGFDAIPVKDYLADLDVFVYFTHSDWVESFGRVIIEAMAVGVPVIVPPVYKKLFEDAAIYAEPDGVTAAIDALVADPRAYDKRVQYALDFVQRRFSHHMHVARVEAILNAN
jgi:glycosyltransferase involved in cell wall biosynthesis